VGNQLGKDTCTTNTSITYARSDPWPDLVVAMLSVNKHPLGKTFKCFDGLSACGLFDAANLAGWNMDEIVRRLVSGGYNRGPELTRLMASRLYSLRVLFHDTKASELCLSNGSRQEVAELLKPVFGIGPTVIDNFLLLRGAPEKTK
jgi:hypothetical protein